MAYSKSIFSDNEYTIMSEIAENENLTQRELSKKLGVSVSTVNVLMNKMIRDGLIKMTQVSQKQVLYMLTPAGIMKKAKKTVSYLKAHYRAIYQTKEKLKSIFEDLTKYHEVILLLMPNDEMGEIVRIAIEEFESQHTKAIIKIFDKKEKIHIDSLKFPVLLHMTEEEVFREYLDIVDLKIVNLSERL